MRRAVAAVNSVAAKLRAPSLLRSSSVVSLLTLTSRLLGYARDLVFAMVLGASPAADAFLVAFKIPNFMRRLFGEGAFSQAYVPVFADYKQQSHEAARDLFAAVMGTWGGILLLVTAVGSAGAPLIAVLFAPGWLLDKSAQFVLTGELLRFTFPYLGLISMTALAAGTLNSYGRFAPPAAAPIVLNITLISSLTVSAAILDEPVRGLALGVAIAGVLQLLMQCPALVQLGLVPRPRWQPSHPGVRRIGALMLPALFGVSVSQINLLLDTVLASFLISGSVSWLYYADRLVELPLGIFAIALATVSLPRLSALHAASDTGSFNATLDWSLRVVLLLTIPAAAGLLVLAGPAIASLLQYGEMSATDVQMAARALVAYSLGLVGFTLVKVLAPGYFARQDTRTPVRFGIIAMAVNMVLNLALIVPLAHAGLALATALAAFVNAALLLRGLLRLGVYSPAPGWLPLILRIGLATLAMIALLLLVTPDLEAWFDWPATTRIPLLAGIIILGMLAFASVALLAGIRPRHLRPPNFSDSSQSDADNGTDPRPA